MGEAARERFFQCGGGRLITFFFPRTKATRVPAFVRCGYDKLACRLHTSRSTSPMHLANRRAHLLLSVALVHRDSTGQPPNEQAALQSRLAAGRPGPRVVRRHVWPGIAKRTAERASPAAQNLAPARFQVL